MGFWFFKGRPGGQPPRANRPHRSSHSKRANCWLPTPSPTVIFQKISPAGSKKAVSRPPPRSPRSTGTGRPSCSRPPKAPPASPRRSPSKEAPTTNSPARSSPKREPMDIWGLKVLTASGPKSRPEITSRASTPSPLLPLPRRSLSPSTPRPTNSRPDWSDLMRFSSSRPAVSHRKNRPPSPLPMIRLPIRPAPMRQAIGYRVAHLPIRSLGLTQLTVLVLWVLVWLYYSKRSFPICFKTTQMLVQKEL